MWKRNLIIALFALVLLFIWGNSMLSSEISALLSDHVADVLANIFGGDADGALPDGFGIRKMAHFVEFFALGASFCTFMAYVKLAVRERVLLTALAALFFPLSDETIQIFSGRGPSVKDVWIDLSGFALGALLACAVCFLKYKLCEKKKKST